MMRFVSICQHWAQLIQLAISSGVELPRIGLAALQASRQRALALIIARLAATLPNGPLELQTRGIKIGDGKRKQYKRTRGEPSEELAPGS